MSFTPSVAVPKARPKLLEKQKSLREREARDRIENVKARSRANGRCEVFVIGRGRCHKRDVHTHHLLSGIGVRARGKSALAAHKLRVCDTCHREIHAHVLVHEGPKADGVFRRIA